MDGPQNVTDLVTRFQNFQTVKYIDVASIAALFYDYVTIFTVEVEVIWPSSFNIGKLLYYATRYSATVDSILLLLELFVEQPDSRKCSRLFTAAGWATPVGVVIAQVVLVLRTWTICNRSLRVLVVLTLLLCGEAAWVFYSVYKLGVSRVFVQIAGQCFVGKQDSHPVAFAFLAIALFDSIVLALTLYRVYAYTRDAGGGTSKLLRVIFRDGVLFYVDLTALSLASAILLFLPIKSQSFVLVPHRIMYSILSSRIILNIRRASKEPPNRLDTNVSVPIDFATAPREARLGLGVRDHHAQTLFGGPKFRADGREGMELQTMALRTRGDSV